MLYTILLVILLIIILQPNPIEPYSTQVINHEHKNSKLYKRDHQKFRSYIYNLDGSFRRGTNDLRTLKKDEHCIVMSCPFQCDSRMATCFKCIPKNKLKSLFALSPPQRKFKNNDEIKLINYGSYFNYPDNQKKVSYSSLDT